MEALNTAVTGALAKLKQQLEGSLLVDEAHRKLYATDASAYRELPTAVCLPKNGDDLRKILRWAVDTGNPLIPRTAGTSLAGQVVGNGIVVDFSHSMTRILEVNREAAWVRVQPGVIRDDLNHHLEPLGLYFAPETSTSNRAMIGGMVGNNSCGSNSVVYGSTRDHILEIKALLSNGEEVVFKDLDRGQLEAKLSSENGSMEEHIYRNMHEMLADPANRESIRNGFPRPEITRRNTGYALDQLLQCVPFDDGGPPFNLCKLLAGSEGTLAMITEIKLQLVPTPPAETVLVCAHFRDVPESLEANLIALKYEPRACELMDHYILECTKSNIAQRKNRFFVRGDPGAILVVDLSRRDKQEALDLAETMIADMKGQGMGYHYPVVAGADAAKVWELRKAGLGLLSNMPGDAKPVPVIEDTAVSVEDLPAYIREFNEILKKYGLYSVHYAHAGSGELHLRPILNLKDPEDVKLFRTIAEEVAVLVKKYGGSLSGEHGDGRLRGEFIPKMLGMHNYQLMKQTKAIWDPDNVFNPGKIVDTPPMDTSLRYEPGVPTKQFDTYFRFDEYKGLVRAVELCNGSGDCRKTHIAGGTMCPSYMATRLEKDTTRARANILREVLTHSRSAHPFDNEEIMEVMDLCLSCKGCKSECPSNVDVAKLKAEFLQQYYDVHGVPLRTNMVASIAKINALASKMPAVYNFMAQREPWASIIKMMAGFALKRSMPRLHKETLLRWNTRRHQDLRSQAGHSQNQQTVYLLCDEFTNYNDVPAGMAAVQLLEKLGYRVEMPGLINSGRAPISKGLLKIARALANENVRRLSPLISKDTPLLGIEPSAILTFRDEYPQLVDRSLIPAAEALAPNCLLIEEFIDREIERGHILKEQFTTDEKRIALHGHCHQKSLSSIGYTRRMLSFPENYSVEIIPSGCCGMAGSFGYEKKHHALSMQIGELVLFPAVRKLSAEVSIAAPGTSCRHQIADGTGRVALHPVQILLEAVQ